MEENKDGYLEIGLKRIKEQSFHINSAIEKNNLRQCLKEAYTMLCELRTNELSPRNYYNLYISVVDIMLIVKNYMIEEINRGRRLIDLYDDVQQAQHVIPRLYLMITAGSIYIEKVPRSTKIIIYDMLGLVKAVQNPIKGLFLRNYLLKMIKDKLPDKDNVFLREGASFEDSLKFIIENMEEMNRLWVRLSSGVSGGEKAKREKERDELKILIGESMNKLSSLESLNIDIYEQNVLPKLLNVILNSKDRLCQQYLMECIIHAFPDSYNVKCMERLLEAISSLERDVDIGNIFISLIQKLGNFFGSFNKGGENNMNENDKQILETARNIYPSLLRNFNGYMNNNLKNNDNKSIELNKLMNLVLSFLKFSIKCCPPERKFESINNIFSLALELANRQRHRLNEDCVNKIGQLLIEPLNNGINIFRMRDFIPLMGFLNYKNRKNLGISLIETLIADANKENPTMERIESLDSLDNILKYIKPLLGDSGKNFQEDEYTFEYEQNIVSKLVYIIRTNNPENIYRILNDLKNIFAHGGVNRRRYTLPPLANRIIQFCHDITVCYESKVGLLSESRKNNKATQQIINSIDISRIENDEIFLKLLLNIYTLLTETLDLISQEQPEMAFNLFLQSAAQVNSISCNKEKFEESCCIFINSAINIFEEGRFNPNRRYKMLLQISSILLTLKINKDKINTMIDNVIKCSQKMNQREDQCKAMLIISQLYFTLYKDSKKIMDCLNRARRFADFAMTNPRNLVLFIDYLNKILYFIEQDAKVIDMKPEQIQDIIELIKGHIRTIRNIPSDDIGYLEQIVAYFNNTLKTITFRKTNSNNKDYYSAIKF